MIMFYDIMLLDDTVSLTESHDKRRHLLESLIHCISGRANIENRKVINFSSLDVSQLLSKAFARAITQR
jgi:ATP-dependent DNA ligase